MVDQLSRPASPRGCPCETLNLFSREFSDWQQGILRLAGLLPLACGQMPELVDVGRTSDPVVEILAEEWGTIAALGASLRTEEWETASECPGWAVRDVLSHMVGTERSLLGDQPPALVVDTPPHVRNAVGALNEAWVLARRGVPGPGLVSEFVEVTDRRLEQMRSWPSSRFEESVLSPVGEMPYREFMRVRVMDCWVHEQDIRVATGRAGHREGRAAQSAIDRIASAMGFIVGKRAHAPEGTSVRFDLMGGEPRRLDIEVRQSRGVPVDDLGTEPTAVLRMDQQSFWRLACGRVEGEAALSAGLVEVEGDDRIAERVLDSMTFMI
jgi:uncharacterized protein (TIGR03083 family)